MFLNICLREYRIQKMKKYRKLRRKGDGHTFLLNKTKINIYKCESIEQLWRCVLPTLQANYDIYENYKIRNKNLS